MYIYKGNLLPNYIKLIIAEHNPGELNQKNVNKFLTPILLNILLKTKKKKKKNERFNVII